MSLYHNPGPVTSGLVFCHDMNNLKSFVGAPSTNLLKNAGTTDLATAPDIYARSTKTDLGNGKYKFVNNGTGGTTVRLYVNLADLTNGGTYGCSVYYEELVGTLDFDFCDTNAVTGNSSSTAFGTAHSGRLTGTFTRATYDSTFRFLDINLSSGGSVVLYNAQVDSASVVTPYITGTRSNAQSIIDLTGNTTVTATSLSYLTTGTYRYNGTDNQLSVTNVAALRPPTELTVELAVKPDTLTAAQWRRLFGQNPYAGGYLVWLETEGSVRALHYPNGTELRCSPTATISASNYTHITATFKMGDAIRVYYNGVLQQTATIAAGGTFSYNTTNPWLSGTAGGSWFAGLLPFVKVYNRALSESEIKQNFNAMRGRLGI